MVKKWIPLESNPEVLNEYVGKLGVDTSKYAFTDVYGLDPDLLAMVPQPVLAVIMCFPITNDSEKAAHAEDAEQVGQALPAVIDLFYLKQTVGNACGTIAVIHSVCNNTQAIQPADGSFLHQFIKATSGMDAGARGRYLEEPPEGGPDIEAAHQTAAATGDTAPPSEDEEVNLHFVAFVQHAGHLWQLDGRRKGPVYHGPSQDGELLADTAKVVHTFIEKSGGSVNFNLIALTAAADG